MSTPVKTLAPRLIVRDADAAAALYTRVLGATVFERYADGDGQVVHVGLRLGEAQLSLTEHGADTAGPATAVILGVEVDDPDGVAAGLSADGGEVIFPVADQVYGKREGRVRDPFGQLWIVSKTIEELDRETIARRLGGSDGSSS